MTTAPSSILDALDIPAGRGEAGGETLIEFLATRPETAATSSATKLVRRFVDEEPPDRLVVAAVAAEFLVDRAAT